MRTTIDIPDPFYRRLKSRAASESTSAKELILRGVNHVLRQGRQRAKKRVKLPLIRSSHPGTLDLDNDKIFEIIPFP
jgi:hypothetical protein